MHENFSLLFYSVSDGCQLKDNRLNVKIKSIVLRLLFTIVRYLYKAHQNSSGKQNSGLPVNSFIIIKFELMYANKIINCLELRGYI